VQRVALLDYRDSGMAGDPANDDPASFWSADVEIAAKTVATILEEEGAAVAVGYDDFGIYGHPDHVQVHRVTHRAAEMAGVATVYDATVDREYLHFVETHLVEEAVLAGDLGLVRSHIGVPTVAIATAVDVHRVLGVKRAAMAAHASQIPETTSALQLPQDHFADVYGWEWYVRTGPPGPLDAL
jgi:LmbE family N-acetylglucosaminyl deacetylase